MVDDFCDPDVVKERYKALRTVIERSALAKYRARIGMVEEVIVEGPSKKDPDVLTGRTAQNKLVHFPAAPLPQGAGRVGTYVTVRVSDAKHQYMLGDFVEVTHRATHRTKIPVLALD